MQFRYQNSIKLRTCKKSMKSRNLKEDQGLPKFDAFGFAAEPNHKLSAIELKEEHP